MSSRKAREPGFLTTKRGPRDLVGQNAAGTPRTPTASEQTVSEEGREGCSVVSQFTFSISNMCAQFLGDLTRSFSYEEGARRNKAPREQRETGTGRDFICVSDKSKL